MAIISASRRTDIPAFFSDWFMNRVREGFFCRVNPFNAKQVKGISLAPKDVDAFVFWSKNPRPLMNHLDELENLGHRYYFQFTLNPYERIFEPGIPSIDERIATFRELAGRIGSDKVVWRYDPVILSTNTPVEWHLERLSTMARELEGKTGRLVFSFLDFYGKVNKRLTELERDHQIRLFDITAENHREEMLSFVTDLKCIGDRHGMEVFSCAENEDFKNVGINHGSCIDGNLIRTLFGIEKSFAKDKNQRGACLCAESVDMGMYNTCSFQCGYCYANLSGNTIRSNLAKHDPASASLVGNYQITLESEEKKTGNLERYRQGELFS